MSRFCERLEEAYKMADGCLSAAETAVFLAHASGCRVCASALTSVRKTREYYAWLGRSQAPTRLHMRVLARLRARADDDILVFLRAMVPAGALAFAALGCWLLVDELDSFRPADLLLGHDNEVAEVIGPQEDPVAVFKLDI